MFDRHKNVKALSMQLSSVLSDANKLSAIIEYAIMTLLSAINESGAVYQERLKKNKLNHHLLILRSKRVELFHVTVM